MASNVLFCHNDATGAELTIAEPLYTRGYQVMMNLILRQNLVNQGVKTKIPYSGKANWEPSHFVFANHSLELYVRSYQGGMMIMWNLANQNHNVMTEQATFFFNPGECRFSKR